MEEPWNWTEKRVDKHKMIIRCMAGTGSFHSCVLVDGISLCGHSIGAQ